MDVIGFLTSSTTAVIVSIVVGLAVKYLPKATFISRIPNAVIPYLNALIVFFTAWPHAATAGVFGSMGAQIGGLAKVVASIAIASMASVAYENYVRPVMDKLGVKKA